jgi:hypothetical protein
MREPERGEVFRIYCRNLHVGVCLGEGAAGPFTGIREKFGARYLDSEAAVRFGYYTPIILDEDRKVISPGTWVPCEEPIAVVPEGMSLQERLGSECEKCCTPASFIEWDPPRPEEGLGRWVCEGGCEETLPYAVHNNELFNFLLEIERNLEGAT